MNQIKQNIKIYWKYLASGSKTWSLHESHLKANASWSYYLQKLKSNRNTTCHISNNYAVLRTFSMRNDMKFVTATLKTKIHDLKKTKQVNILNFLFLLHQKLKVLPKFATVGKPVTVISSTLFDCENRFAPEKTSTPKDKTIDRTTSKFKNSTIQRKKNFRWIEKPTTTNLQAHKKSKKKVCSMIMEAKKAN